MNNIKKIYIADSYALNTGDLGILFATLQELKAYDASLEIDIESSHPHFLQHYDEVHGHQIYPRLFDIQRIVSSDFTGLKKVLSVARGIRDSFLFIIWALLYRIDIKAYWVLPQSRRVQAHSLASTDLILSSGGGFLSSYYKYGFRLQLYLLAFILNKPVMIFAQSVGPFNTWLSRTLVPFFLRRMRLITIREQDSYEYLKTFMPDLETHLVNDIAFLLHEDQKTDSRYDSILGKSTVAFCLKDTPDIQYRDAIVTSASELQRQGYDVIFVSQTPADDAICHKIATELNCKDHVIPFGISPCQLKAMYGKCEFIIANRMHAIVFAAASNVPFICLAYEPKFAGLFQLLAYTQKYLLTPDQAALLPNTIELMLSEKNSIREALIKTKHHNTDISTHSLCLLLKLINIYE